MLRICGIQPRPVSVRRSRYRRASQHMESLMSRQSRYVAIVVVGAAGLLGYVIATGKISPRSSQPGAGPPQIPPASTTPDKVETRICMLEFKDRVPSQASAAKVYDHLDFTYA